MRRGDRARRIIYGLCMGLCVLTVLLAVILSLPEDQASAYDSLHPACTMAPLTGFTADALVNTGDAKALDALPGVGEVISQRIVETRDLIGGYRMPTDLLQVKGIGEKTLAQIVEVLADTLVPLDELSE